MPNKFFLFIIFPLTLVAGNGQSTQHHITIDDQNSEGTRQFTVHLSFEPHIVNANTANAETNTTNMLHASTNAASNSIAHIKNNIPKDMQESAQSFYTHIQHKWKWYAIGATYLYIAGTLLRYNKIFKDENNWMNWKKTASIETLQLITHNQLAHELLQEIQSRYVNQQNPTDSITPLVHFVRDMQQEEQYIKQYLWITALLKKCYISKIFPYNDKQREEVKELQQRLHFIRHIFISWAATHNANKIT